MYSEFPMIPTIYFSFQELRCDFEYPFCHSYKHFSQGKSDESPEMIRNLITSIIQSSLYRVYEKDLLNKLR